MSVGPVYVFLRELFVQVLCLKLEGKWAHTTCSKHSQKTETGVGLNRLSVYERVGIPRGTGGLLL